MHGLMQRSRWFDSPKDMQIAIQLAERVLKACIGTRIIAVGQSAAWLAYIAGRLKEARGQDNDIGLIPFSGNFMKRAYKEGEWLNPPPHYYPTPFKR